jgi:hypothetical protein
MTISESLLAIVAPKRKPKPDGTSVTSTYNVSSPDQVLTKPTNRDHLEDVWTTRQANDSTVLMRSLFKNDPDVSAALNAYLTVADTEPWWIVRDKVGEIDRDGHKAIELVLRSIFTRSDYTKPNPFEYRPSMRSLFSEMRHMALLRGSIAGELLIDKSMLPAGIRQIDSNTLEWTEKKPGQHSIEQVVGSERISLDTPTFFVAFFRRDPLSMYSSSFFVSSINTVAARQQVINDLYRIMRQTGFPRIDVTVLEEVLRKNAPAEAKKEEGKMREFVNARLAEISSQVGSLRADQAFIHTDTVTPRILNEKNPAAQLDVSKIIETLNAANQAALKVMATIIGRGESGVNTASVESRIFSLNAEQLNQPISDFMSSALTLALRLSGSESTVEFGFENVELRPPLELEPQKTMRQSRYLELLSLGLITDDEFHLDVVGRIRPDSVPELTGTGFMSQKDSIDVSKASPNSDPLGRALTTPGSKSAKSDAVKRAK